MLYASDKMQDYFQEIEVELNDHVHLAGEKTIQSLCTAEQVGN